MDKILIALAVLANSDHHASKYERFFHFSLKSALESGHVIQCSFCSVYIYATTRRKKFCADQCRWDHNNGRSLSVMEMVERRKSKSDMHGSTKNIVGQKFGRLTVVSHIGSKPPNDFMGYGKGRVLWHCVCDCGGERDVTGSNLKSGTTRSCGCYVRDSRHDIPV